MKTTTSTKPTGKGTLRTRNPKTGRFEKATANAAKLVVDKAKPTTTPNR
jgi:hypothetical protein